MKKHSVFQKSDAKIEITITATNLSELNILLAALIIKFLQQLSGTVTLILPSNFDQYSVLFSKNHCFLRQPSASLNVTNIMSLFVTLPAVSMLIGIFHIGKFCF